MLLNKLMLISLKSNIEFNVSAHVPADSSFPCAIKHVPHDTFD